MTQSRLYFHAGEAIVHPLLSRIEFRFEEDGFPISAFEDLDNPGNWTVSVYCETQDASEQAERLSAVLKSEGHAFKIMREDIPDTDWVEATLRELVPVRAGNFVVHGAHDKHVPRPHEVAIQIDAGLAFGTGHHGTTAGCLDMLTRISKRSKFHNILDLGTGSGVLAIALAKTQIAHVMATDIDPVSVETARVNAHINQAHTNIECITATGFAHRRFSEQGPYDLIVANILANPLKAMAHDISRHLTGNADLVLSGLLPHQRASILATFRVHGMIHEFTHIRDGWLTLVLKKP